MLRLMLPVLGAALLFSSGARAHAVHAHCAYGPMHSGTTQHFHPGGYGQAVFCDGRSGYAPAPYGQFGEPRRRHRQNYDYDGSYYRPYR